MNKQKSGSVSRRRRATPATACLTLKTLPLAVALCFSPLAQADTINTTVNGLPQGGTVTAGSVSDQLTATKLTLTQTTQRAVIDWQSFNIGAGKEVQFIQPNANAAVLNRVAAGANMSEIYGTMSANGTVVLMNPNGVMFSQGASVNVGSLIVTTGSINQTAFMAEGPIAITGATTGQITNEGRITAADAGLVAMVAPSVSNQGLIVANRGTVLLGGAAAATISLNGGLYEFVAGSTASVTGAKVSQSGTIQADGGRVVLTATSASALIDNVINMNGIIQARTLGARDGSIVLEAGGAGGVQVAGTLDATGAQEGHGGQISVTGQAVTLTSTAHLDASGDAGGGTILVGGNWQGQGGLPNARMTTVEAGATLRADALGNGDGGTVVVWSDVSTRFQGAISARGGVGGGDGGAVEVSGKQSLAYAGTVDTTAAQGETGSLLLDPVYAVISSNPGGTSADTQTFNAASLVSTLNTTNVTVQADSKITVDTLVDASGNTNANELKLDAPTVDLNAAIILKEANKLKGSATTVNVNGSNARIQNGIDVAATGANVNVAAGTYAEQVKINKAGISLLGSEGAVISVANSAVTGITIAANNATIQGFEIQGPLTQPYTSLSTSQWDTTPSSLGIQVDGSVTGFRITGNKIHDIRTGIRVQGTGHDGAITNNEFDNTKGGVLFMSTNGAGVSLTGNKEETDGVGNEWGIGLNITNIGSGEAPTAWQSSLLALANANNQMTVLDRKYTTANRTRVVIDGSSTATSADDFNLGSGLGNSRQPLTTIQSGINAVVAGGKVNVKAGTYAESVTVNKALTMTGAGAGQSIIDPVSGDAVAVSGAIGSSATVLIDGFTFRDAGSAGVSVASNTTLGQLTVQNSEFLHNGKFGFFVNGLADAGVPGLANVSLLNSTFIGNGASSSTATSLGQGGINLNYYNGNLTLRGVTITGDGEHMGLQMRGYHNALTNAVYDVGTVVLDDVTFNGSFLRPTGTAGTWNPGGPGYAIHLLEYGSVANVSFNNVKIEPTVGHGMFLEGLGSTLNLGNTTFSAPDRTVVGTGTNPTYSMNIVSGANSQNNVKTHIDATRAVFTGAANGFDIEDRVGHALDISGLGLVTWNAGNLYVTQTSGSIERAIDAASAGNTVNVSAGSYAQASTLNVNKRITLAGAGETNTVIDARSLASGWGMYVSADDVTLKNFSFYGPSTNYSGAYGIKVAPSSLDPNARLRNFTIQNVTSRGAGKAELDLNGVDGALIDRVTLNGAPVGNDAETSQGAGLQITDSANVTVRNTTTLNNAWGGAALYQANTYYNQQVNNITLEASNRFNELNPVYLQDQSSLRDFGTLSIAGFDYAVRNVASADSRQYTWLQATQQKAYDFAVNRSEANSSYIQGWNGSGTTQNFDVGVGNLLGGGTQAMSIGLAIAQAPSDATIRVGAGTYAESVVLNNPYQLRFSGATLNGLTLNAGAANTGIGGALTTNGSSGMAFNSEVTLLADTTLTANNGSIRFNGLTQNSRALTVTSSEDITLATDIDLTATLTAGRQATVLGRSLNGTVRAATLTANAGGAMTMALDVGDADIVVGTRADLTGRANRVGINAPIGNLTGSFSNVDNTGSGLIKVNGRPLQSDTVAAVIDNVRVVPVIVLPPAPPPPPVVAPPAPVTAQSTVDIPSQPATAAGGSPAAPASPAGSGASNSSGGSGGEGASSGNASSGGSGGSSSGGSGAGGGSRSGGGQSVVVAAAPRPVTVTRGTAGSAGASLDRGQGVELDLTPGR